MGLNLAGYLQVNADKTPDKEALVIPLMKGSQCVGEERITFGELSQRVKSLQGGWKKLGLVKGDRVIVLFRPSVDLYATIISLIALGMVPVFIDTGMPRQKVLMALKDSRAKAIVSLKALVRMFWIIPLMWRMKRFAVDGRGIGYRHIDDLKSPGEPGVFSVIDVERDDHGLISFTSGSTGRPKGADRTQGSLESQHRILRAHLPDKEGDIDLTSFPVWVLHNLCCGMTTVLPKVDLAKPGDIDPETIYQQLITEKVTRLGAAPAFMGRLTRYMEVNNLKLDRLNLVFTGGATVPLSLARSLSVVCPEALCKVVYGSTEAEPISSVQTKEFVRDAILHNGYLVGKPVEGVQVCISALPAEPVTEQQVDQNVLPPLEIGEILVSGEHVLKGYVDNPAATRENKVQRREGTVWHRTGDTGFFDEHGRIWLTGRVKDVITFDDHWVQPFMIEKVLDEMEEVDRSAVIQSDGKTVLFVQPKLPTQPESIKSISDHLKQHGLATVSLCEIEKIPVDARHNSKIDRPLLRKWVLGGKLQYKGVIE